MTSFGQTPPPAAAPSRPLASPRVLTRWWFALALAAGLTLLIAAALAAGLSKMLWGYWFVRPGVDSRILSATQVHSITWVEQVQRPDGTWALAPWPRQYVGPGWYEQERAQDSSEYDYYLLTRRALLALERRGVLTGPVPTADPDALPDVAALIRPTLARESRGYEGTIERPRPGPNISVVVYDLSGKAGDRLLLVAVSGCWVANDHYPFYELLFRAPAGGPPELLSTTRFYYDLAGFEGVEFPEFFAFFSIAGLALVMPTAGVALLVSGIGPLRRRLRRRRGLCPGCAYDLRGVPGACPECGRPR